MCDTSVQHYSAGGLAFLESKHPAPRNGGGAEDWSPNADIPPTNAEPITSDSVRDLVRTASRGAASGADNFPMDVLKQLGKTVAKKEFPVDTAQFLDNLTDFLNRVFVLVIVLLGFCSS